VWPNVVKQLVQHDWLFLFPAGNTLRILDIGVMPEGVPFGVSLYVRTLGSVINLPHPKNN